MWRRVIYCIIAMSTIGTGFSIESLVSPHAGNGHVTLSYWDTNGTDTLRVYLLPCDISDDGIQCETMKESTKILEKKVGEDGSETLTISGGNGLYRVCVKLKDSGRQDCDKDNYYMLQESVIETVVEYVEVEKVVEVREIEVDIVSVPTEVVQNATFTVRANITNPFGPVEVDTYSYVYNGSRCVSGGWTANKRRLVLDKNYTTVSFNNTVYHEGLFKLKVRVKHNDTDYDSQPIEIYVEELKFAEFSISRLRHDNNTIHITVTNSGNIGSNATLVADTFGVNASFYVGADEKLSMEYPVGPLNSPTTVFIFSENTLHSSSKLSPPSLVTFAVASEAVSENFLFAILSTLTLMVLGVAVWKR